jgi:carbon storage regulator
VLVLTRKADESILIGENIKITLLQIDTDRVKIGIDAPRQLRILRYETMEKIRQENRLAAGQANLAALSRLREETNGNGIGPEEPRGDDLKKLNGDRRDGQAE